jgi:hypothetical protein
MNIQNKSNAKWQPVTKKHEDNLLRDNLITDC